MSRSCRPSRSPHVRPLAQRVAAACRSMHAACLASALLVLPMATPQVGAAVLVIDDFSSAGTPIPARNPPLNVPYGFSAIWDDTAGSCCTYGGFWTDYSNAEVWGGEREAAVHAVVQPGWLSTGSLDLDLAAGSLAASLTNGSQDGAGNGSTGWTFLSLSYRGAVDGLANIGRNAMLAISFDQVHTSAASGQFQVDVRGLTTPSGATAGVVSGLVSNSDVSTTLSLRLTDYSALKSLSLSFWSAGVAAGQVVASQVLRISRIALDYAPVRALNTLLGAGSGDDVTLTATETLDSAVSVNSLTVKSASVLAGTPAARIRITGDTNGVPRLATTGPVTLAPAVDFGGLAGTLAVDGGTRLAGGLSADGGLSVTGQGWLELGSAGRVGHTLDTAGGVRLVLRADDAIQGATVRAGGVVDLGGSTQHVQAFTGAAIAGGFYDGAVLQGSGTLVASERIALKQSVVDANLVAPTIDLRGGDSLAVRGNVTVGQLLGGSANGGEVTVSGVVSGTGSLVFNSDALRLTARNTYTGSTQARTLTLSGQGRIAGSGYIHAQQIQLLTTSDDGPDMRRLASGATVVVAGTGSSDAAQVGTLRLQAGPGSRASEQIGTLYFNDRGLIDLGTGQVSLQAAQIGNTGALIAVDLGSSGRFSVRQAPTLYGGTDVVRNLYTVKRTASGTLYAWAAYNADGQGSITEKLADAVRITEADASSFIRLARDTNVAIDTDLRIGGLTVDTTESLSGRGSLTLGSGELVFWQDNTIDLPWLRVDTTQSTRLLVSNAGTNTIASGISAAPGPRVYSGVQLVKRGSGTLVLAGYNSIVGTNIEQGAVRLQRGSQLDGQVNVHSTGSLVFGSGPTVDAYSYATLAGTGVVQVDADSRLGNWGTIGSLAANGLSVRVLGSLANYGTASVSSNQGQIDNRGALRVGRNQGEVLNRVGAQLQLQGLVNEGMVTNAGTALLAAGTTAHSDSPGARYVQTEGSTVINGSFFGDIVLDGGLLGGSGKVVGNVLAHAGSTVAPGNSPGTLTVTGTLHLAAGAVLTMQIASATSFDQVVAGAYQFDAGSVIAFDFGSSGYGASDFLAGADGSAPRFSLAGLFKQSDGSAADFTAFQAVTLSGLSTSGGQALTQVTASGQVSAVPEPGRLALLLSGLGLLGWRGRRHGVRGGGAGRRSPAPAPRA